MAVGAAPAYVAFGVEEEQAAHHAYGDGREQTFGCQRPEVHLHKFQQRGAHEGQPSHYHKGAEAEAVGKQPLAQLGAEGAAGVFHLRSFLGHLSYGHAFDGALVGGAAAEVRQRYDEHHGGEHHQHDAHGEVQTLVGEETQPCGARVGRASARLFLRFSGCVLGRVLAAAVAACAGRCGVGSRSGFAPAARGVDAAAAGYGHGVESAHAYVDVIVFFHLHS